MKAVRLTQPGLPLQLQDLPEPPLADDEILVRVKAAGICHTVVHYRAAKSKVDPLPLTLGHEVAGVIEKLGTNVKQFQAGDRVCLHYMVTCGMCPRATKATGAFWR